MNHPYPTCQPPPPLPPAPILTLLCMRCTNPHETTDLNTRLCPECVAGGALDIAEGGFA